MSPASARLVIGIDDPHGEALAVAMRRDGRLVIPVSTRRILSDGYYWRDGKVLRASGGAAQPVADLAGIRALPGRHNGQNAAAALAAVIGLGVPPAQAAAGLASFPGLPHRIEWIAEAEGVGFVNDSKATNAAAAANALACFDRIYWIAGGRPKADGIAPLASFFPRIAHAFLIGEAAADFAATLDGRVPYDIAGDLDSAVGAAFVRAVGDGGGTAPVVLLSPACASFDQFTSFEARGERFRQLVQAIVAGRKAVPAC
jgi:UDP-N-acetylmuramoylalanine--D-glutamate ligase